MRKLIVLLVLIAICGAYSAYWYKKSQDFKQVALQDIASVNDKLKQYNNGNDVVHYESIRVAGYPLDMKIELIKPVFDVPMSNVIQAAAKAQSSLANLPAPSTPAITTNWVEEISFSDKITLSANITGDRFTLAASGDTVYKAILDGAAHRAAVSSSAQPIVCHLTLDRKGKAPWTIYPLFTDLPTFFDTFSSADCDQQSNTLSLRDAGADTLLFSSDAFHVAVGNESSAGGNHKLSFAMESKNGKATAAADQLVKEILQLSSSLAGNSSAAAMIPMSEYGTQNVKFAMHYDGPVESKNMTPAAQVHFDIDTFEAHNALANTAFQLHLGTAVQDNNRTVSITLHADSDVTERYDQLIAPLAADAYNNALQQQKTGPNASMVQTLSQLGTPQEVMATVLPKFHTFGKTTFDIDASAQGPDNTKAFFQQGKYTVNAFNWIAEPYGFKLAASVPNQLPFGDVTFTCITCDALINDMGDYGMRVEALVDKIPPGKQPYLSKNLIEGVKAFLHGISQNSADKTAKDLVIHVVMGNTGVTVSDKQIPEVMNIFATTVAPFIPKPQAPPPAAR